MPLPLRREYISVEFVAFLRCTDGIYLSYIRLFVGHYRFAATVTIFVDTDYRPVIHPLHRLQVNKATISAYILKVEEPVFSGRSVYPSSLVRSIDGRITLRQYSSPFIRTIHIFRTEYYLPTGWHTACRMEDIIIAVPFIKLRAFTRLVCFVTVEDNA